MPEQTRRTPEERLQAFATEPYPFHELSRNDFDLTDTDDGNTLTATKENATTGGVTYEYRPTTLNVYSENHTVYTPEDIDKPELTYADVWEKASNTRVRNDAITTAYRVNVDGSVYEIEARWVFDSLTIST